MTIYIIFVFLRCTCLESMILPLSVQNLTLHCYSGLVQQRCLLHYHHKQLLKYSHVAHCRCGTVVELFSLLFFIMDGLTVNDVPPTCEASQTHQCSGYGYSSDDTVSYASAASSAALQYSASLTHSSCAEAAAISNATHVESEVVEDCIQKVATTAYAVSSASRQSPLLHQTGVVVSASGTAPPPPCSSDLQRQMPQCSSYHSRCPVLLSSSASSSSCREATKANPLEPPKKPLTPYMRFSKSVRIWFDLTR